MNIFDRAFGNCRKGIHRFENFLIRVIPPKMIPHMKGDIDIAEIMESLSERTYEIRCKPCGQKAS